MADDVSWSSKASSSSSSNWSEEESDWEDVVDDNGDAPRARVFEEGEVGASPDGDGDVGFAAPVPLTETPEECLRRIWGFDGFRPFQREAIDALDAGKDVVVSANTASGKSLTYLFGAAFGKVVRDAEGRASRVVRRVLIVSPLVALMANQAGPLRKRGLRATFLGTTQLDKTASEGVRGGDYTHIFISPERLIGWFDVPDWVAFLRTIDYAAIDEAHCINRWGGSFRPEFSRIGEIRDHLPPGAPLVAVSATITRHSLDVIKHTLRMGPDTVFVKTQLLQPNLFFELRLDTMTRYGRPEAIVEALAIEYCDRYATSDGIVIIYMHRRKDVDGMAHLLELRRRPRGPGTHVSDVMGYHAGMTPEARIKAMDDFMGDRKRIVVATTAFGMGVDKPNIRCILIIGLPDSIESFVQAGGRGGRDGQPARVVLVPTPTDPGFFYYTLESITDEEERKMKQRDYKAIQELANGQHCIIKLIGDGFGERLPVCSSGEAARCSVCKDNKRAQLPPPELRSYVACMLRPVQTHGQYLKLGMLIKYVMGTLRVRDCQGPNMHLVGLADKSADAPGPWRPDDVWWRGLYAYLVATKLIFPVRPRGLTYVTSHKLNWAGERILHNERELLPPVTAAHQRLVDDLMRGISSTA